MTPTFKATMKVAVLLCMSRVLGFVRSQAMAALFGATGETDAFVVAISVVTLATSLTGPITVAFLPVYAALKAEGDEDTSSKLASSVMTVSCLFMMATGIVIYVASPFLARVIAPGFREQVYEMAVSLTKIIAPAMVLPLLASFAKSILNTYGKYTTPAAADVVENVVALVAMLKLAPIIGVESMGVALGLGFLTLFGYQLIVLLKMDKWPRMGFHTMEGVGTVLLLAVPFMCNSFFSALHHLVDKSLASRLPEGSLAILNYAERVRSLPVSILVAAVTTVMIPTLSGLWGKKDFPGFHRVVSLNLRAIWYLTIPAAFGFMVLSTPLTRLAFQRGAFTEKATELTSRALTVLSPGIPLGATMRIISNSFVSAQDTKTAVIIGVISSLANIAFNLLLVKPFGYLGLALSHTLSAYVSSFCAFLMLKKHGGLKDIRSLGRDCLKMVVASTVMAAFTLKMAGFAHLFLGTGNTVTDATRLFGIIVSSGFLYFFLNLLLNHRWPSDNRS